MLKYKSLVFLLVCSFTISSSISADTGVDAGNDVSVSIDVGNDVVDDANEGPEKSTPLDPDYQPDVTSSPECTCRSVQNKTNYGWFPILLIGAVLGFSRKKWQQTRNPDQ